MDDSGSARPYTLMAGTCVPARATVRSVSMSTSLCALADRRVAEATLASNDRSLHETGRAGRPPMWFSNRFNEGEDHVQGTTRQQGSEKTEEGTGQAHGTRR